MKVNSLSDNYYLSNSKGADQFINLHHDCCVFFDRKNNLNAEVVFQIFKLIGRQIYKKQQLVINIFKLILINIPFLMIFKKIYYLFKRLLS